MHINKGKKWISIMLCTAMLAAMLFQPQLALATNAETEEIMVTQTVTEDLALSDFSVIGCSIYNSEAHTDLSQYYVTSENGEQFNLGGNQGWSFLAYDLNPSKTLKSFEYDCYVSSANLPISLGYANSMAASSKRYSGFVGMYFDYWNNKYSKYQPYFLGNEASAVYDKIDFGTVLTSAYQNGSNLTANLTGHVESKITAGNYHIKFDYIGTGNQMVVTITRPGDSSFPGITLTTPAVTGAEIYADIPSLFFRNNVNHVGNMKITYTEEVNVADILQGILNTHSIAKEIQNGLTLDDIAASEASSYAGKASTYQAAYAEYSEAVKELLVAGGYYDEVLLQQISNLANYEIQEHKISDYEQFVGLTKEEFTKIYEKGTDSVWAWNKAGNKDYKDRELFSFEYDITKTGTEFPIALGYSNILGSQNKSKQGFLFATINFWERNNVLVYKAYMPQQESEAYAALDFTAVSTAEAQVANNNNGSMDSVGNGILTGQTIPAGSYHVKFTYTGKNSYILTVTNNSDSAYSFEFHSNEVTGQEVIYDDIPSLYVTSNVTDISNITFSYLVEKDLGASVAAFVNDNPSAGTFHCAFAGDNTYSKDVTADTEENISAYVAGFRAGDTSLAELLTLKAAYESADVNLQKALVQYGYYNETAVGRIQEMADEEWRFTGVSMSAGDSLALTYYVKIAESLKDQISLSADFAMDGVEEATATGVQGKRDASGLVYGFTFSDIRPQEMVNDITVTVTVSVNEGVSIIKDIPGTMTYSAMDYCNAYLKTDYDSLGVSEDEKKEGDTLIVDLVGYCAAAQTYHEGKNTISEQLVNDKGVSGSTGTVADMDDPGVTIFDETDTHDRLWTAVSVVLKDKVTIRSKFKMTENVVCENLHVVVTDKAGETIRTIPGSQLESLGDGLYQLDFDDITPIEYGKVFSFAVYNDEDQISKTLSYSVNQYLYTAARQITPADDLRNLFDALYRYGTQATKYMSLRIQ